MSENQLLQNVTYEKLYQNDGQNIWFLAWVLQQQYGRIPNFNQKILSVPFTVKRQYHPNGQLRLVVSYKNYRQHGMMRVYQSGLRKCWSENGNITWEFCMVSGLGTGLERQWYNNGQLEFERYWRNNQKFGTERRWSQNGLLISEKRHDWD